MMPVFVGQLIVILIQFLSISFLFLYLAYEKKSRKPLIAMGLLFIAFCFDETVTMLPHFSLLSGLHWNWQGKILGATWPFVLVYSLKWLTPKQVGFVYPEEKGSFLYTAIVGAVFVTSAILYSFYTGDFPAENEVNIEMILFQLTLPGLSEELVFRGVYLAILKRYIEKKWSLLNIKWGWGDVIVTGLFVAVHCIAYDAISNRIILINNFVFPLLIGITLVFIREKTKSVWPCVLFHNMANGMYLLFYFLWYGVS